MMNTTLIDQFHQAIGATRSWRTEERLTTFFQREYLCCQAPMLRNALQRNPKQGRHDRHVWELGNKTTDGSIKWEQYICLGDDERWDHNGSVHLLNYAVTDEQLIQIDGDANFSVMMAQLVKEDLDRKERSEWPPVLDSDHVAIVVNDPDPEPAPVPRWLRGKKPIGPTPHRRRG